MCQIQSVKSDNFKSTGYSKLPNSLQSFLKFQLILQEISIAEICSISISHACFFWIYLIQYFISNDNEIINFLCILIKYLTTSDCIWNVDYLGTGMKEGVNGKERRIHKWENSWETAITMKNGI